MAHYPFADELGSVPDVLKGNCREKVKILEMGAPARKRLIEKVFGEMRLDNQGIRLSDLPEAFQVSKNLLYKIFVILNFFAFF